MGWEDEAFMVFLVGGLIILAVMMLMFGPQSFVSSDYTLSRNVTNRNVYSAEDTNLIRAEVISAVNSRIDTRYVFNTRTINIGSKYIQNGLLFGSNDVSYKIDSSDINSARLSFDISKTNSYNELVINVNGKTLARQVFQPGHYELDLTGYTTNLNLEIFALSSDWRVWAPNVYQLDNVKIATTQYYVHQDSLSFYVSQNEFRNFKEGRIEFVLSDATGTMNVAINGRTIFSGLLSYTDSIRFGQTDIKEGMNTISFRSNINSVYAGMIRAIVLYDLEGSNVKIPIDLSQKEYNDLNRIELRFRAEGSGLFDITTVNDNTYTVTRNMPVENTDYMFVITKDQLKSGVNDIVFGSDSSFDIKGLTVDKW